VTLWEHFGDTLGAFWGHFGSILGTDKEHLTPSGTDRELFFETIPQILFVYNKLETKVLERFGDR
jgi:hypothetical protein